MTKAVSDSIRMDMAEMARADAEVRDMMETTHRGAQAACQGLRRNAG